MVNTPFKRRPLHPGWTKVTRVLHLTLEGRALRFGMKPNPNTLLIVAADHPNEENQPDQPGDAPRPFPLARSRISNGMRPPVIGPERPKVWPRDLAALGVEPYIPPPRPPTREQVVLLAERHGLAVGERKGFVASLRRHLSTSMQAPGSKNPSEYYMKPFLENIPLSVLGSILEQKYWSRTGGDGGVGVVTFQTDSSTALGKLYELESCASAKLAIGCGKLVLPPKVECAVVMLIRLPSRRVQ